MRWPIVVVVGWTIAFAGGTLPADEKEEIRKLIPTAAAMQKADWEKLAAAATPNTDDIEEQSLTLHILMLPIADDENEKQQEEFRFLEIPRPAQLAAEISRTVRAGRLSVSLGPTTAIHANRITDLTCSVERDTARGTVRFTAPELYQGKVDYVARRQDGAWQITEFVMPARGIHLVRSESGAWRRKD